MMRNLVLCAALAACGATAPTSTRPDPRASREAFLSAIAARLDAGDGAGLVELADIEEMYTRTADCSGEAARELRETNAREAVIRRERLVSTAAGSKGRAVSVLAIDAVREVIYAEPGDLRRGCTFRKKQTHERLTVRFLVDGKPSLFELDIVNAAGRYYIFSLPPRLAEDRATP
jgi:hypothetical protein